MFRSPRGIGGSNDLIKGSNKYICFLIIRSLFFSFFVTFGYNLKHQIQNAIVLQRWKDVSYVDLKYLFCNTKILILH